MKEKIKDLIDYLEIDNKILRKNIKKENSEWKFVLKTSMQHKIERNNVIIEKLKLILEHE